MTPKSHQLKSDLRKRDYSRGGCRECKRRKIKCDETKPTCLQCTRLSKECAYPMVGERVLRVSKRYLQTNPPTAESPKPFTIQLYQGPDFTRKRRESGDNETNSLLKYQEMLSATSRELGTKPYTPKSFESPERYSRSETGDGRSGSERNTGGETMTRNRSEVSSNGSGITRNGDSTPDIRNRDTTPRSSDPINTSEIIPESNESPIVGPSGEIVPTDVTFRSSGDTIKPSDDIFRSGGDIMTRPGSDILTSHKGDSTTRANGDTNTQHNDNIILTGSDIEPRSDSILTNDISRSIHSRNNSIISRSESMLSRPDNPILSQPFSNSPTSSLIFDNLYNHDDLDVIASDLNSIVNDIMFQSNFDQTFVDNNINKFSQNLLSQNLYAEEAQMEVEVDDRDKITKHVTIDGLKVNLTHEKLYLEDFFHDFAMQILPFGSYDKKLNKYFNPIRDTILTYASSEPFLLAAVLAQGARTSYIKNKLQRDQEAYASFLSTCLQLLGPALTRNRDKKVKDDLTSNIECILLTVLLLTSANATTTKQSWRPHLKGAKDIILKATNSKIKQSKTLILCKVWFIDFEVLAGTSSSLGGTLRTDEEIDAVMQFNDDEIRVLTEYGILSETGYNIMFGYSNDSLYFFRDMIKIMNKKRIDGDEFKQDNPLEYLRLLGGFYQEYNVEYINRRCLLPLEILINDEFLPDLIDIISTTQGNVVVSWMDLSQQAYSLAAIITIYTHILELPYNHPNVQSLNSKLIDLIGFLAPCHGVPRQHIGYSFLMIQWPMLVAALNCTLEEHKYLIMKFFRISVELGSGSAELALKKIVRCWEMRDRGEEVGEDDEDVDIVAY